MKGFKSFADSTVLEFEPGVTAVVGPNGSGKSNVVDAVTWVLGAQSTRALRSAKMDDVIFAGTAHKAALGRAEVALTLDNSSGRLSIDGAEVTISRTLFRNGDSEYAINATPCRLLDVQELLSDSGVGRQQHMIIGQGQLDSILNSSSENRRAVIEEAAGVLKHRRRKERAERRLASTQENLERLGDLVREVRRQMRPLERQAVSARSYADLERELRQAREVLFCVRLHAFEERRRELEVAIGSSTELERELRHELVTLDAQATTAAAEMASRREEMLASTLGTLQGLAERARGTLSVIAERERSLRAALVASADENVIATLEADAAKLAGDLVLVDADEATLRELRDALADAQRRFADASDAHHEAWDSVSLEADHNNWITAQERLALLERSWAAASQNELSCTQRLGEAQASVEHALTALAHAEVDRDHAASTVTLATSELTEAMHDALLREAARERADAALAEALDVAARTQARYDALSRALEELSGSNGRAIIENLDGVLGSFLDLIEIDEGWERAVESAAGASVGAVVVDGRRSAQAALETLQREGGAGLVLPVGEKPMPRSDAPAGCVSLRSLVRERSGAPAHVTRVLDALFSRAFVADSWPAGIDVAVAHPDLVIVTREGDRFANSGWRLASGRALVTRATVEDAQRSAKNAQQQLEPRRQERADAAAAEVDARQRVNDATAAHTRAQGELERREREIARVRQQLADGRTRVAALSSDADAALKERSLLENELEEVRATLPVLERSVQDASQRRAEAEESLARVEALRQEAQVAATVLSAREAEFAERRRLIEQRSAEIEARLEGRSLERAQAAERREALEFDLQVLSRLTTIVSAAAEDIRLSQEAMDSTYREQLEASRAGAQRLEAVRQARQGADARLAQVAESAHRGQIELAELAVKVTNLHEAIRRDLGVEPHELAPADVPELEAGVTLESLVGDLEARISSLGPINPLALEELATLEERYVELDTQVADVRHARRELQEVVHALDAEIMATFSEAVADVNEHFSTLISMLFPGGQGRLILTDPEDLLTTGVEIEVRPMGRNVRRISLLSGGERSMAALAFLFAVFRSRPSPFYMMDEVEAALDDVNLQRFLSLVDEFRDEAQLLIVTHQKRTMEAADALYGVTMVPGASSKVVSQRVKRTPEEVTA
jgi:chromosome segregation protein